MKYSIFLASALLFIGLCWGANVAVQSTRPATVNLAHGLASTPSPNPVQIYADANSSQATLAAAEATAWFFNSQLTATVEARQAQATQQAWNSQATRQSSQQTSTASAWAFTVTADSLKAAQIAQSTQTAQAMALLSTRQFLTQSAQRTATPLAATQLAVVAAAKDTERRMRWNEYAVPAKMVLSGAVLLLIIALLTVAFLRMLSVFILRKRAFGSNRGDILFAQQLAGGRMQVIDPSRSFAPVIEAGPQGGQISGNAPHPLLQARVTEQAQQVDLARVQPAHSGHTLWHSTTSPAFDNQQPAAGVRPGIVNIEVVDPQRLHPWLQEVEGKLLTSGKGEE